MRSSQGPSSLPKAYASAQSQHPAPCPIALACPDPNRATPWLASEPKLGLLAGQCRADRPRQPPPAAAQREPTCHTHGTPQHHHPHGPLHAPAQLQPRSQHAAPGGSWGSILILWPLADAFTLIANCIYNMQTRHQRYQRKSQTPKDGLVLQPHGAHHG